MLGFAMMFPQNPKIRLIAIALPVVAYVGVTQDGAEVPLDCRSCPDVPADTNAVVFAPD
jgi:hypothetical protein